MTPQNLDSGKKKYLVYPDYVFSVNDGDRHYISADKLINIYGVPRQECIIVKDARSTRGLHGEFLALRVKIHAEEYTLDKCEKVAL